MFVSGPGTWGRNGLEASYLVKAGMTPLQAIEASTANGPDTLGPQAPKCGVLAAGFDADVITLGNHAWDQREMIGAIDGEPRILRPLNYPPGTPGRGMIVFTTAAGKKVLVIQVMGRLFMDPLDDPFAVVARELDKYRLGVAVDAIVVDIHAEASSEKMSLGHYCDGRVSLVVGSHTHIPTADSQIFPGGTGYHTDAGMCGDYDSVIGMRKEGAVARFVRKMPIDRLSPAEGEATVCGVIVTTHEATGLASDVRPLRIGGRLQPSNNA